MAGIYLHIPFCRQKCSYCNFHFSTSLNGKDSLLRALREEMNLQGSSWENEKIDTIYFGGGTPSLLSADEINVLVESITKNFRVEDLVEFTLEANPDDLTKAYIRSLRNTAIDRFSIGIQSFSDPDLRFMNRAHTASQAEYAIKAAQDAGFDNLTIDLIFGTPGLSDDQWKYNLKQVKQWAIPHFSAYGLTVESGTLLHHAIATKKLPPVAEEQSARQFEILLDEAKQMGYEHYEISNLCLPGHYARHNTSYWKGEPYLGIGPSAHSFNGKERRWNVANNALYVRRILDEHKVPFEGELLTKTQLLNEYIMTSLRTKWGCDLNRIEELSGKGIAGNIEQQSIRYQQQQWMLQQDSILTLTQKGKLFADRIASELFQPDDFSA